MPKDKKAVNKTVKKYTCKKCNVDRLILWILVVIVTVMAVQMFNTHENMTSDIDTLTENVDVVSNQISNILNFLQAAISQSNSSGGLNELNQSHNGIY